MSTSRWGIGLFCVLAVMALGAGCSKQTPDASSTPTQTRPAGPRPAVFDGLSAEDATKKVQLTNGSVLVMKQGFGGIGGKVADLFGVGGTEGTREIVIQSFAPGYLAEMQWKLMSTVDGKTKQTTGTMKTSLLQHAHLLDLPGYWQEGDRVAQGGVIWLSQDVYEDLAKVKKSSIDFGIFTPELVAALPKDTDLQNAIAKVKDEAIAAGNKTDVYYMAVDPDQTEKKITLNGKETTVKVITARNWFGEIVVLANPQNPLVLKVTLNPLILAASDSVAGTSYLSHAMGYEVTEIHDIQE